MVTTKKATAPTPAPQGQHPDAGEAGNPVGTGKRQRPSAETG
jgi:hypothetical protein